MAQRVTVEFVLKSNGREWLPDPRQGISGVWVTRAMPSFFAPGHLHLFKHWIAQQSSTKKLTCAYREDLLWLWTCWTKVWMVYFKSWSCWEANRLLCCGRSDWLHLIPIKDGRNNGDQGRELPRTRAVKVNSGSQPSGPLGETTGKAETGVANF